MITGHENAANMTPQFMLGLDIAYLHTKFDHSMFTWFNHASFRDGFPSEGWQLLRSIYLSNLKSLFTPTMKIWKMIQKNRKWD